MSIGQTNVQFTLLCFDGRYGQGRTIISLQNMVTWYRKSGPVRSISYPNGHTTTGRMVIEHEGSGWQVGDFDQSGKGAYFVWMIDEKGIGS